MPSCKVNGSQLCNSIVASYLNKIVSKPTSELSDGEIAFFKLMDYHSSIMDTGRNRIDLGIDSMEAATQANMYSSAKRSMEALALTYATGDPIYFAQYSSMMRANYTKGRGGTVNGDIQIMDFLSSLQKDGIKSWSFQGLTKGDLDKMNLKDLVGDVDIDILKQQIRTINVYNYISMKEFNAYGSAIMGRKIYSQFEDKYNFSELSAHENLSKFFDDQIDNILKQETEGLSGDELKKEKAKIYKRELKGILGDDFYDPFLFELLRISEKTDIDVLKNYTIHRAISGGIPSAEEMAKLYEGFGVQAEAVFKSNEDSYNFHKNIINEGEGDFIFKYPTDFLNLSEKQRLELLDMYRLNLKKQQILGVGGQELTRQQYDLINYLKEIQQDFGLGKDARQTLVDNLLIKKVRSYGFSSGNAPYDVNINFARSVEDMAYSYLTKGDKDFEKLVSSVPGLSPDRVALDVLGASPSRMEDIIGSDAIKNFVLSMDISDQQKAAILVNLESINKNFTSLKNKGKEIAKSDMPLSLLDELDKQKDLYTAQVQDVVNFIVRYEGLEGVQKDVYSERAVLSAVFGLPVTTDKIIIVDTNKFTGVGLESENARKKLYDLSRRYTLSIPTKGVEVMNIGDTVEEMSQKMFDTWLENDGNITFIQHQRNSNDPVISSFRKKIKEYADANKTTNKVRLVALEYGPTVEFKEGNVYIRSQSKEYIESKVGLLGDIRDGLLGSKVVGEIDNQDELDEALEKYISTLSNDMQVQQIKEIFLGDKGFTNTQEARKRFEYVTQTHQKRTIDIEGEKQNINNMDQQQLKSVSESMVRLMAVDGTFVGDMSDVVEKIQKRQIGSEPQKLRDLLFTSTYGTLDEQYVAKQGLLEYFGIQEKVSIPTIDKTKKMLYLDKNLTTFKVPYDFDGQYNETLGYVIDNYETLGPTMFNMGQSGLYESLPEKVKNFVQRAYPKNKTAVEPRNLTDDMKAQYVLGTIADTWRVVKDDVIDEISILDDAQIEEGLKIEQQRVELDVYKQDPSYDGFVKRALALEEQEKSIGKVGKTKIGKEAKSKQEKDFAKKKEALIEEIGNKFNIDTNAAYDVYDAMINKRVFSQSKIGTRIVDVNQNYDATLHGNEIVYLDSLQQAGVDVYNAIDGYKKSNIQTSTLDDTLSEIIRTIDEFKGKISLNPKENKKLQELYRGKLYNLQTRLANEYGALFDASEIKNMFYYLEKDIPFVPDQETLNALDGFLEVLKGKYSALGDAIKKRVDNFNERKITQESIDNDLMVRGYTTITNNGKVGRITAADATKKFVDEYKKGTYSKNDYLDRLSKALDEDPAFISKLPSSDQRKLYTLVLANDFAGRVYADMYMSVKKYMARSDKTIAQFFNTYGVVNGLPEILRANYILDSSMMNKEKELYQAFFDSIKPNLIKGGKLPSDKEIDMLMKSKIKNISGELYQKLYDKMKGVRDTYSTLIKSGFFENALNKKVLKELSDDLVSKIVESQKKVFRIMQATNNDPSIMQFLKTQIVNTDSGPINVGEVLERSRGEIDLTRITNSSMIDFDIKNEYITGKTQETRVTYDLPEKDLEAHTYYVSQSEELFEDTSNIIC